MRHLFSVWTEGKNERERRREGDGHEEEGDDGGSHVERVGGM